MFHRRPGLRVEAWRAFENRRVVSTNRPGDQFDWQDVAEPVVESPWRVRSVLVRADEAEDAHETPLRDVRDEDEVGRAHPVRLGGHHPA